MDHQIRAILAQHGRMTVDAHTVADTEGLHRLGLTSHACVSVMLAIEDAFDIEFPDSAMAKSTFESVANLREVVANLCPVTA